MGAFRIGEAILGLIACVLAAYIAWGTWTAPAVAARTVVGPGVFPSLIAAGLLAVGVRLLYDARAHDTPMTPIPPIDWPAVLIVGGSLLAFVLLLERLGWVLSGTLLFMGVARGFGSRAWLLSAVIGLVLTILVFVIFDGGLGLNLPVGEWIEPVLEPTGLLG
ncbi:tripartite tricarboxylate transporter TctB family protein [Rubellimicrobium arenae]|uniref:tripartite tricarboxylate transporter TctB family protein n=1 Tax=Rubellimicrobium arenae TaxID=2817372 RepID=UPI001B3077FD|nr:tripartite tricarboxylate transporter TctB family protein [Rubellimicrobium arenae]